MSFNAQHRIATGGMTAKIKMSLQWLRALGFKTKIVIVIGGSIIIGASTYLALVYSQLRRQKLSDEGFVEAIRLPEELPDKRILVLGMENSGKTSFLSQLSNQKSSNIAYPANISTNNDDNTSKPSIAFNVVSVQCSQLPDCTLNFWEIGHKKNMRSYWTNYFQDTDLVIFCVDSADEECLPKAYDEFHTIQADERLKGVPIIILATKQDMFGALNVEDIKAALDIDSIQSHQHKVHALPLSVYPKNDERDSVRKVESLIRKICLSNG